MKKQYWTAMLVAIIVTVLVGCGSSGEKGNNAKETGGDVTLNALFMKQSGYSDEDVTQITKKFESENPNIRVNLTFVAYEALEQKILTSSLSGDYDVVLIDQPWTAKFAQAGIVKKMTERLSATDREDIFQPVLESAEYKGDLYAMPWLNDTKYLFYNKELLSQAGFENPPQTWEELYEQAKVIKEKGLVEYPLVWSWSQAEALVCDFTSLVYSFGGQFVDENGNPSLKQSANQAALEYMQKTMKDGLTNPNSTQFLEEDVRATFSNGKAAFALNWTYMMSMANDPKESAVAGKVGVALSPGTEGIKSASVNGGQGLSITAGSKHPDEAWKYIAYMSSKEVQKEYAKNALPIWKSLYEDAKVMETNPELVKIAKEQYQYVVSRPMVPWYGEYSQFIQVGTQQVLLGQKTPEQGLSEINEKAEKAAKDSK